MKLLVMGGTSFVSKAFAMYAIKKGYTVDIFTRGRTAVDYEGVNQHLVGDRRNEEDIKKLITEAYDYVVDVNPYFEEDVRLLCEALDTSQLKRYVMCSTASVYMAPEGGKPLTEDSPRGFDAAFGGDYGLNKMKAEDYLLAQDVPVTIFRPTYIYGEYNNIYRDAFLFDSIESGHINVLEDGCKIGFIYIGDLVRTMESCFEVPESINQAYNVSHPEPLSWSRWLKAGIDAVGKKPNVTICTDPMIEETGKRIFPFGQGDIEVTVDKLSQDGLYTPNTPFEEGIKNAYDWYQKEGQSIWMRGKFEL